MLMTMPETTKGNPVILRTPAIEMIKPNATKAPAMAAKAE